MYCVCMFVCVCCVFFSFICHCNKFIVVLKTSTKSFFLPLLFSLTSFVYFFRFNLSLIWMDSFFSLQFQFCLRSFCVQVKSFCFMQQRTWRMFPRRKTHSHAGRQDAPGIQQSPTETTQTRTNTIRHLTPRLNVVFLLTLF